MHFFDNAVITVLKEEQGKMHCGRYQQGKRVPDYSFSCDVQPLDKQLFYNQNGYMIDSEYKAYADKYKIKPDTYIEYEKCIYQVEKVEQWDTYTLFYFKKAGAE